jgi:RimJ/RimL family protein N-acetyltransferase
MTNVPIRIRAIRPDDADRLVAFHERLSPESQRLRFFSIHPHLQRDEVRRFVNVDGTARVALVATRDDDIVGVARFDRIAGTSDAEAALVIQDDLQGRGLGTELFDSLAARARADGVTRFVAQTLPENARMRNVLRHVNPHATTAYAGGVVETTVPLTAAREVGGPDG